MYISGLYITGFHVLDRVLDSSEITTHASSCHVTETDDVIDMGALQEISVSGISVISSSNCDGIYLYLIQLIYHILIAEVLHDC